MTLNRYNLLRTVQGGTLTTLSDSIDPLIAQAVQAGRHASAEDAVKAALHDYLRAKHREDFVSLIGTIDFDPAWDYKAQRRVDTEQMYRKLGDTPGEPVE